MGFVLQAWLTAFNSGDRAQTSGFRQANGFAGADGGFALIGIEKSEPLHLEAPVKEREGANFARLTLDLNDSASLSVRQLGLKIVPRPANQPEQVRVPFAGAERELDSEANQLANEERFSGAILLARGEKIAFEKAYGLANREKHQDNSVDTKIRIGARNKMFTATAVLQLVGEGKIDLEAPLGRYLKDYSNGDVSTKVTIRHLFTHTGGTGDIFTPEYEKHRLETRELTDYVMLYGARTGV